MPRFGLGVYKCKRGTETFDAVHNALRLGYRRVDTAQWYRNESDVGAALAASGLPRERVFVTTKLWLAHWGYERAAAAVRESHERLGGARIDLLLLHAPGDASTRAETWRALEDLRAQGLVRDIGVSNFSVAHLEQLVRTARVAPAVNQVELHPWLARRELVAYCQQRGILLEAYSPLVKGSKLDDPTLAAVAAQTGATPAQVLVAYSIAKGYAAVAKSVNLVRQRENLEGATSVQLSKEALAALDALDEHLVCAWDPSVTHAV